MCWVCCLWICCYGLGICDFCWVFWVFGWGLCIWLGFLYFFLVVGCIGFCLLFCLDGFCFGFCWGWLLLVLRIIGMGLLLDLGSVFWCGGFLGLICVECGLMLNGCVLSRWVWLVFWSVGLDVCMSLLLGLWLCLVCECVWWCCWCRIVLVLIGWCSCCLWIGFGCFFRLIGECVCLNCCCWWLVLVWMLLFCCMSVWCCGWCILIIVFSWCVWLVLRILCWFCFVFGLLFCGGVFWLGCWVVWVVGIFLNVCFGMCWLVWLGSSCFLCLDGGLCCCFWIFCWLIMVFFLSWFLWSSLICLCFIGLSWKWRILVLDWRRLCCWCLCFLGMFLCVLWVNVDCVCSFCCWLVWLCCRLVWGLIFYRMGWWR